MSFYIAVLSEVQVIDKYTERLVEVVQLHPLEKVVDRLFESIQIQDQTVNTYSYFEQIELQAKLLNYFLGSNKSNINHLYIYKFE